MPYKNTENKDGIEMNAQGNSYNEVFTEGARALFDYLFESKKIMGREKIELTVEAESMDKLFIEWLKELLSRKDITGLVFGDFEIASIQKISDTQFLLMGFAYGEPYNEEDHKSSRCVQDIVKSDKVCANQDGKFECNCLIKI